MAKPVNGKHYKEKHIVFCGRNLFKDCLLFVPRSSFSFFLLQSHDEIELLSAFCAGESAKLRKKQKKTIAKSQMFENNV